MKTYGISIVLIVLLTLTACGTDTSHPIVTVPVSLPIYQHIVVVVEENRDFEDIFQSANAPYLNQLVSQGAYFTHSYAVTHPSQPNYIALFSGSTDGVSNDSCVQSLPGPSLGAQILAAGGTFIGYSESLPAAGYTGCIANEYYRKHNPWVNFSAIPADSNQPFSAFPTDFNQLPLLSFVVPNVQNDMHDGSVAQGDAWLKTNLSAYAQWAQQNDSLLVITWDEADLGFTNQIMTIFYGAHIKPGAYSEDITHYTVLRTLEQLLGLPPINEAKNTSFLMDIWA